MLIERIWAANELRNFKPVGKGFFGVLDRLVLHLSIGEAY